MGLMEVAWLGPKAITFNCTEGVDSIRAAAHYWLAETGLFHHAPADGEDFSGYSPTRWQPKPAERETHQLKFSVSARGNPDLVTVSWGKLVEAFKNDERYSEHVRSALRTFLEHDPDYRAYRKERLDALECRCRRLKKRIIDLKKEARKLAQKGKTDDKAKEEYKEILQHIAAHENSLRHLRRRLKKPFPKVIALGCAAWDCQQEGSLLPEQITRNQLETISLKGNTEPDPRYAMRRLRKLQEQAGCFKKKSPKKGRSKRVSQVAEPISVVETLYPGIKLRT